MALSEQWLLSTWVKAPHLAGSDVLVASACLPAVNRRLFEELAKGKVVLLACPEREPGGLYGKVASIIRSSRPRSITVVTIDGSPHCLQLHAALNEAEYILGERVEKRHCVLVNGRELREVSADAVRVARYLHLVDELLRANPWALSKLKELSLEYQSSLRHQQAPQEAPE